MGNKTSMGNCWLYLSVADDGVLRMFSRSDAKTADVVILALGTTERDARDVAVALLTNNFRSSHHCSFKVYLQLTAVTGFSTAKRKKKLSCHLPVLSEWASSIRQRLKSEWCSVSGSEKKWKPPVSFLLQQPPFNPPHKPPPFSVSRKAAIFLFLMANPSWSLRLFSVAQYSYCDEHKTIIYK